MPQTFSRISRRDWLKGLALFAAPKVLSAAKPKGYTLQNNNLSFHLTVKEGKVVSRRLHNRLSDETLDLPLEDFALEFDLGTILTPSILSVESATQNDDCIELLYLHPSEKVSVRVQYQLPDGKSYLRKQILLRHAQATSLKVMRADLDNWKGIKRNWKSMRADPMPYGSHPIFCETLWAGVEFVAAFNQYDANGFVLRSRPGSKPVGPDWLDLHSTVAGVTRPEGSRDAFLSYIDDVRLARPRLLACYNTWWSLPHFFKEDQYLALIRKIKEELYGKHRIFFDLVTTDAGWSDRQSIWRVNRRDLPDALAEMVQVVESAGGKPGLWMCPSEIYSWMIDYAWAERNGYFVIKAEPAKNGNSANSGKRSGRRPRGLSLADPKYRKQALDQLQRLVKKYRLGQMKYDGFIAKENQPHGQLLPGDDSVEPLAEYSLELIKASKEANPDLVAEPTYLNSWANYISPWMIKYAEVVWANAGADCPRGLGPAPDYREAQTTAREYYIFASLDEVWLPQNAVQYFDIINCDAGAGFPNHAAMAFGRGRFYVPSYLNPKFTTDEDWQVYAGLLGWARKNQDILQDTHVLTARVELGEPYAYGHWLGTRGLVAVRNPSNETQDFTLSLQSVGAPQALKDAVCYTQYPYRKGLVADLDESGRVDLKLAPWELLFLEIVPRSELREPVAVEARWYRNSAGKMMLSPANSGKARVLLPGTRERTVATKDLPRGAIRGEISSWSQRKLAESEGLKEQGEPLPTDAFELECTLSIPGGCAKGNALLLVEFPGRGRHYPSTCSCQVNGSSVDLEERSSEGHIGHNAASATSPWKEVLAYQSEWTWYIAEIGSGESKVKFAGTVPSGHSRVALYGWADWDLGNELAPTEIDCPEPEMPQYREYLEREGIRLIFPVGTGLGRAAKRRADDRT